MASEGKKKDDVKSSRDSARSLVVVTLVALAALVFGLVSGFHLKSANYSPMNTHGTTTPVDVSLPQTQDPLWPLIEEIAEHFLCGCMQCGDMSLVECLCEMPTGGIAEKQFIRQQLVARRSKDEIIVLVQNRFGARVPTVSELNLLDGDSKKSLENVDP